MTMKAGFLMPAALCLLTVGDLIGQTAADRSDSDFYGHKVSLSYKAVGPAPMQSVADPAGGTWKAFAQAVLNTDATMKIGTCKLQAGTYTVFPIESGGRARLIVNSERTLTASYDAAKDLCRVELAVDKNTNTPVVDFEMRVLRLQMTPDFGLGLGFFEINRGPTRFHASLEVPK